MTSKAFSIRQNLEEEFQNEVLLGLFSDDVPLADATDDFVTGKKKKNLHYHRDTLKVLSFCKH